MSSIFWNTIASYNQATWAAQLIICAAGILLTVCLYRNPTDRIKIIYKLFLSFCFAWISIVFFILYGSIQLNKFLTASLFGLISFLFFIDVFANKTTFTRNKKYNKISSFLYILLAFYPLFSLILGKHFPVLTTWLMPCPLTVFAIALLISFFPQIDFKVFTLLVLWALSGLPKIFMFQVPEDSILFISGILAILVWLSSVKKGKQDLRERRLYEHDQTS